MFAVLYRFTIKPESEAVFTRLWTEATKEIKAHHKHKGSRLHKSSEGEWLAYTVWESQEKWELRNEGPESLKKAISGMSQHINSVEQLFKMDVVGDLLDS